MIYTAITDASGYFGRAAAVSLFNPAVGTTGQLPGARAADPRHVPLHRRPQRAPRRERAATARTGARRSLPARHLALLAAARRSRLCARLSSGCPCSCCLRSSPPRGSRRTSFAPSVWSRTSPRASASGAWSSWRSQRRIAPSVSSWRRRGRRRVHGLGCCARSRSRAVGLASAVTYLNRPIADRYGPFTFADVALAMRQSTTPRDGGPSTLLIIDGYDAMDVQFLDAGRVPTIVDPSASGRQPGRLLVGGRAVARRHRRGRGRRRWRRRRSVVAIDPSGNPGGFEVVPQPADHRPDRAEPRRRRGRVVRRHYRGCR